jgi:hypothetical protein
MSQTPRGGKQRGRKEREMVRGGEMDGEDVWERRKRYKVPEKVRDEEKRSWGGCSIQKRSKY